MSIRKIIAVSIGTIRRGECRISACEHCDRTADTPFGHVLASSDIEFRGAEVVMSEPAHCPACGKCLLEHTLVEVA